MGPSRQPERQIARAARRVVLGALAAVAISSTANAGERLARLGSLLGRESVEAEAPDDAKAAPLSSTLNWWSIPKSARVAAKTLAAAKDATVTRCVAVTEGDVVTYEIHASRRVGPFRREDFRLTSVSEPAAVAEKRRQEQTLERRMARVRSAVKQRLSPAANGPGNPSFR